MYIDNIQVRMNNACGQIVIHQQNKVYNLINDMHISYSYTFRSSNAGGSEESESLKEAEVSTI